MKAEFGPEGGMGVVCTVPVTSWDLRALTMWIVAVAAYGDTVANRDEAKYVAVQRSTMACAHDHDGPSFTSSKPQQFTSTTSMSLQIHASSKQFCPQPSKDQVFKLTDALLCPTVHVRRLRMRSNFCITSF